jgi:tetratricopeptide (TPR) repeat protein
VFGLISLTALAWPQALASPAFPEIEKQATEAREAKRLDEAVTLYREGLRLKPAWNEGSWYLGTSLYALQRYDEARDTFRHLAIVQPSNGQAWALAGMCEFELKNYLRALEYLSRAENAGLEKNPELAYLVRFRIALLLNRKGEPGLALNRLIPIAAQGSYPEVTEAIGLSTLRARLLPSEVPETDRDLYVKAGKAMTAYAAHDNATAARLFRELVTIYPDRPNVHYARGTFLMDENPEAALPELQRELELNPSHAGALGQVAKVFLRQGAPEKALTYARRSVAITPSAAGLRQVLGECLLESGNISAAIGELRTASRLEPEVPQTHFLLADAYRRSGNKVLANKEMAEFQRLDKKQKSALSGSGVQENH